MEVTFKIDTINATVSAATLFTGKLFFTPLGCRVRGCKDPLDLTLYFKSLSTLLALGDSLTS